MPAPRTTLIVVVALAALAGSACGARYLARMRRALYAERAARRLEGASHHRDMDVLVAAMRRRLGPALCAGLVLYEADSVLSAALNSHRPDPEGGTPS